MNSKYIDKTHTYGRVWIFVTLALFLCIPALICYHLDVFPKAEMVFKGLATVAAVVNPEIFVIGGGVSKAGEILLKYVEPAFAKYVFSPCRNVKFALATLGNDAGIYGAAGLILR